MFSDFRCYHSKYEAIVDGGWDMPVNSAGFAEYKGRRYKVYEECQHNPHSRLWHIGRFIVALIVSLPLITLASDDVKRLWREAFTGEEPREIYVLHIDSPPSVPDHIAIELPNLGNTCWLNSTLKFIASTDYYDRMLFEPPPNGKKELQWLLNTVIRAIREGAEDQTLSRGIYLKLLHQIRKHVPECKGAGYQQLDAVDFLRYLPKTLGWTPLDPAKRPEMIEGGAYPQTAERYVAREEKEEHIKFGCIEPNIQTLLEVTMKPRVPLINLALRVRARTEVEIRPDKIGDNLVGEHDTSVACDNYTRTTVFTHLPNTMVLYLKRFIVDEDGYRIKISSPILTQDHLVSFVKYETERDEDGNIVAFTRKKRVDYQIAASISHFGSELGEGHFVCYNREGDEAYRHSDREIIPINNPDLVGVFNGYIIRLEKVGEEEL
ncbi:MAG: hypothetical protein K1000chlam4_00953 [Chlamydiae bacterium]|nr:hypothetical protein [Chlamydiota bacterium]